MNDHATLDLRAMLGSAEGMSIVGEAGDKPQLTKLIRELEPDILLFGLGISEENDGLDICREVKTRLLCPPRVLIYTASKGPGNVALSALAGADGYVSKELGTVDLVDALRRVYYGQRVWFDSGRGEAELAEPLGAEERPVLTSKEHEVYALKLRRLSNVEIAERLSISERTVKSHVSNVMRKLGVRGKGSLR